MAFSDTIRTLPFGARTPNGSGFLPPMVRTMGHILYLTGCLADENVTVTDEEAHTELNHAVEHWNARALTESVSTATTQRSADIGTALQEARAEFASWDAETRINNLRDLSHRILQYSADLDRELVGIPNSDPGSSL